MNSGLVRLLVCTAAFAVVLPSAALYYLCFDSCQAGQLIEILIPAEFGHRKET
jgi:hypothetical protein